MWALIKRNLLLYFRDKSMVFFSMFSSLILVAFYIMFFGPNMQNGLEEFEYGSYLINRMLLAGMLSMTPVTTAISTFSLMIRDRARKRLNDFHVSPIKRSHIVFGFITSAVVISFVTSMITFSLFEIYNAFKFGIIPTTGELAFTCLIIIFTGAFSAALGYFASAFIPTQSGYGSFNSILSTLLGFINGLYIETGSMSELMKTAVMLFPTAHLASLIRKILVSRPAAMCFGKENVMFPEFNDKFGVSMSHNGRQITTAESLIFILLVTTALYALSVIKSAKPDKEHMA